MKKAGLIFLFGVLIPLHLVKTSEFTEVEEQVKNLTANKAISQDGPDRAPQEHTGEIPLIGNCSQIPREKFPEEKCLSGPPTQKCSTLNRGCLECTCASDCMYGDENAIANCTVQHQIQCDGDRKFQLKYTCQYCYQSNGTNHRCEEKFNCNSVADPNKIWYKAICKVPDDLICLGQRKFLKLKKCNWTGGYKWSTALVLSITLGGFGADRFYLGHWQEGIGKLFSFGGLGVWTLVDVVMVAIRYIGPADGSLYI